MTKEKTLKLQANQAGLRYALTTWKGAYIVRKECRNYDGKVRGGMRTSWCLMQLKHQQGRQQFGMTLEEAEALFARGIAGKARC
jgi:hypothetical protein